MKTVQLLAIFLPFLSFAQIENKIEGVIIDIPCELKYIRGYDNISNYNCEIFEDGFTIVYQYSLTVDNLSETINNLNGSSLETFKNQYLQSIIQNFESKNQSVEVVALSNAQKAFKTKSYLTSSGTKFVMITIVFLYNQKVFYVNLGTNDLEKPTNIISRIKIE